MFKESKLLKISCIVLAEIELLAQHGVMMAPEMQGLTEQQVEELKIKDSFADVCIPSGGFDMNPDPVGRRNGRGTNIYILKYIFCTCP